MKRSVAIASNQKEEQGGGYKTLPEEVWHLIWNKMSNKEQLAFSTVSKRLYEMVPASITEMLIKRKKNPASSLSVLKRFSNLTHLKLSHNKTITDQDILFLTRLQSLELKDSDVRLSSLKCLTNLTNIAFGNRQTHQDNPSDYAFLTRLKSIHIKATILPDLTGFTNIATLYGFGITEKMLIANASSLTSLGIMNVSFNTITESTASSLTKVSRLFLMGQDLNNLSIASFPSLTKLVITFTVKIDEEILLNLTNLTTLHFHYTPDISNSFASRLTNLRDLCLDNTHLTLQKHHFKNLTNLSRLSLNIVPEDESIGDEFISNFYNLTELYLHSHTTITDNGIENLTRLSSLKLIPHLAITEKSYSRIKKCTHLDPSKIHVSIK